MRNRYIKNKILGRTILVVIIMLIIAAVHGFRLGTFLSGRAYIYYYSFASDIMLPFGSYFLLSLNEIQLKFLRKWYIKALIVFCVMTFSEVMQYFEIYLFGVTFDCLDIIMYALGVLLAVFFDKLIFEKFLPFWNYNTKYD